MYQFSELSNNHKFLGNQSRYAVAVLGRTIKMSVLVMFYLALSSKDPGVISGDLRLVDPMSLPKRDIY